MTPRILVGAPDLPHPPFTGGHLRPSSLITALVRGGGGLAGGALRARAGARCHLGGVATGGAAADSGACAAAAPEGAQKARAT